MSHRSLQPPLSEDTVLAPKTEFPAMDSNPPAPMVVPVFPETVKPFENVPRPSCVVLPLKIAVLAETPPLTERAIGSVEVTLIFGAASRPALYEKEMSSPKVGVADPNGIIPTGMVRSSSVYPFDAASVASVGVGKPVILSLAKVMTFPVVSFCMAKDPRTVMAFSVVHAIMTGFTNKTI